VVLRPGADPGIADPDTVVEPWREAHDPIVPDPVPEPPQRHAVPVLDGQPGRRLLARRAKPQAWVLAQRANA
jgi:hypothetical protein